MEWLKILFPLLGGGAVGAIITMIVTNYRNKIQSVGHKIQIDKIFYPEAISNTEITKITFSGATQTYHFDNLFLATILLTNEGNKDIEKFICGITLPENIKVVKIETVPQDRHHSVLLNSEIKFDKTSSEIDFELIPFNRKDTYEIKLYITISSDKLELSSFKLGSPHPIKFVALNSELFWNSAKKVMEFTIGHY
ncbi:MAG TPA: hypothetical protein PLJ21_08815 [Pseudobdellovibrionaceae bacterium]|nr:hypothetical protein [Pseudobdellovibrionaceae bacterium]